MATDEPPDKPVGEMDVEDLFQHFSDKCWNVCPIIEAFSHLKEKLGLQGKYGIELYSELKSKLTYWKAKNLWELLDKKAKSSEYKNNSACKDMPVLIVGCGPVGMRLAVECSLLGCNVVMVEKRDYFSRYNVLHLWPFTIDDLKRLGAKKFYGQFCAGAIDHISIRTLQCILLKIVLLLGVRVIFNVEFLRIKEPGEGHNWRCEFSPSNHPLNDMDFRVLVGAEGKKSRIPGFDRKELRAKLALALTANFVNYHTQEEAAVQEISGVAFIFNQKFFKDLRNDTGIDLENIVYYKDDTHYFIMTAKKESLLQKGVLKKDYSDIQQLLHPDNRNIDAMLSYACEAADWSTDLPKLEFALNHKNKPDVDLFDFTSIYQAEYAAKAIRREDSDLLVCLVGDSLVQPFWPQGSGCARGFLSAMDAAWMIRGMGMGRPILELLSERECLYQRLTSSTPDNLMKKFSTYTINPTTRYPNLNLKSIKSNQVKHLYDTGGDDFEISILDDPPAEVTPIETTPTDINTTAEVSKTPPRSIEQNMTTPTSSIHRRLSRKKSSRINVEGSVTRALYGPQDTSKVVDRSVLLKWFQDELKGYPDIHITDLRRSFRDGRVLLALIHRYNPEHIPNFSSITSQNPMGNNRLAFKLALKHYRIEPLLKPSEMDSPDSLGLLLYLSTFYEFFQNLPPAEDSSSMALESSPSQQLKLKLNSPKRAPSKRKESQYMVLMTPPSEERSWNTQASSMRRGLSPRKSFRLSRRDRSSKKKEEKEKGDKVKKSKDDPVARELVYEEPKEDSGKPVTPKSKKKSKKLSPSEHATPTTNKHNTPAVNEPTVPPINDTPTNSEATPTVAEQFARQRSNLKPLGSDNRPKKPGTNSPAKTRPVSTFGAPTSSSDMCYFCNKRVYLMERMSANNIFFHRNCFRCAYCNSQLSLGNYSQAKGENGEIGKFYCNPHYRQLFLSNPKAINYSRSAQPSQVTPEPSPPPSPLNVINEDEVTPPEIIDDITLTVDKEVKEEENFEEVKRSRTFTASLYKKWRDWRHSRKSKSPSATNSTDSDLSPQPHAVISSSESPPTSPPCESPPTSPIVDDKELPKQFRSRTTPINSISGTTPPPAAKKRGQKSIVRHMVNVVEEEDETVLRERQKQQARFLEAQTIQRETSQIELQYEELEEIARDVEQNLRDAEGTSQEESFMKAWLNLVKERNALVRRTGELSLQMKVLELEDRHYEIEKELRDMPATDDPDEGDKYERLLQELILVVDEKDNIVQQVEMDRVREQEEEESHSVMMSQMFGLNDDSAELAEYSPAHNKRGSSKRRWPWNR